MLHRDKLWRNLLLSDNTKVFGSNLRPIPKRVTKLFDTLDVPLRLGAHLLLVYDVAIQIVTWLRDDYPKLSFDEEAVLFGAITHDIGKVVYPAELSQPGSSHEWSGYELLLAYGFEERLARFTRTHSTWTAPGVTMEDLLVSLADKVWKGKRVTDLEQLILARISTMIKREIWELFLCLDDLLECITKDADQRLAFQLLRHE